MLKKLLFIPAVILLSCSLFEKDALCVEKETMILNGYFVTAYDCYDWTGESEATCEIEDDREYHTGYDDCKEFCEEQEAKAHTFCSVE